MNADDRVLLSPEREAFYIERNLEGTRMLRSLRVCLALVADEVLEQTRLRGLPQPSDEDLLVQCAISLALTALKVARPSPAWEGIVDTGIRYEFDSLLGRRP